MTLHRRDPFSARRGSVLLLVMWLMIAIGLVALSYTGSVRSQYQAAQAAQGRTQAYWAARAGVEKARALLAEADLTKLAADDKLFDDDENFMDQPIGPAQFSIFIPAVTQGETPVYGLADEAARINLNTASDETIMKLPNATQDLRDSLGDWRDTDGRLRPLGAELDYYRALEHSTVPRDGPLYSLRELLRVRDWQTIMQAAYPDPYARYAAGSGRNSSKQQDPEEARKLLAMLTVWSRDARLAPDGKARMVLSSVTDDTIRQRIPDLTEVEAFSIVKRRDSRAYESLNDLFEVKAARRENESDAGNRQTSDSQNKNRGKNGQSGGGKQDKKDGEKIFDRAKVGQIIDYFTIKETPEEGEAGLININTAPTEVLEMLPGISETLAAKIVDKRILTAFAKAGEIADVEGMTDEIFKQVYPTITARSQCFHAWVRGVEPDSGANVTIETVLAVSDTDVTVVYWREN